MKKLLLFLFSGLVNAVLGYYFYYVLQMILGCFYLIGYYLGFVTAYQENGEESILFALILVSVLLLGAYMAIMTFMNHLLIKIALMRRRYALLINGFIFLAVFIPRAIFLYSTK
ncbi:hypothetical protein H1230_16715 [Paenibacillus sp. 19GGS1-52]|uniref:hypothetical protein n=1 Tax=Paenibacillus sp. 19GGS1-52 TaxID=2758563 RepID=UPI001EFBBE45|nr:hypothetical protein [Paenibacillus sp. 19GGS1-52]ULO04794.1 hypothetical protein H1230_16715 [Paenibacillus sp. 19GGS1-52]